MTLTAIPFQMPEPLEIPAHLADSLAQMPAREAVAQAMDLLLQIDAARVVLYEALDGDGSLRLVHVAAPDGETEGLAALLSKDPQYGRPVTEHPASLPGRALSAGAPLLVMGQAGAGDDEPLSPGLATYLAAGDATGNVGFIYVLPLTGEGACRGFLTLLRPPAAGPLNHEQPNIAEGLRRLLVGLLEEAGGQ